MRDMLSLQQIELGSGGKKTLSAVSSMRPGSSANDAVGAPARSFSFLTG